MKQTRITVAIVFAEKFPAMYNEGLICAIQSTVTDCFREWCVPAERIEIVGFEDQDQYERRVRRDCKKVQKDNKDIVYELSE